MNRGEVWWADHPDAGRRPYLIMTRQAVIPMLRKVTAVPATERVQGHPLRGTARRERRHAWTVRPQLRHMAVMPKGWFVGADLPVAARPHGPGMPRAGGRPGMLTGGPETARGRQLTRLRAATRG